jgi:phage terminase large subunit GpA-like protein
MRAETERQREAKLNICLSKILNAMKPPDNITVSQWADKNRRLTSETSAEAGRWRTSRTPYMMEVMDCFTDPRIEHIVVVAPSQVGKSEVENNIIGYIIDQDPGPILFIQPTVEDAKRYSEMRLAPMIRDTKCLRKKVADPKTRDGGNTKRQKSFPGGFLVMAGSNVSHDLSSMPMRYVIGDERDRWAASAGTEGDPWELAKARTRTFYNRKLIEVSTPTVKGSSAIEDAFNLGTMERWVTQCRHCGEYSEIQIDQIRFPHKTIVNGESKKFEIEEIYYICPRCGGISNESEVKRQHSKWQAEAPEAKELHKTRSFWLTAWLSPWVTWKEIILNFLQAGNDPEKLQVCYNTMLGKLWEARGDMESEESVMARREEYKAEIPDGVIVLTCGVDTQDDRLEYEVVGYGHFGESWGIKKGVIMGRPDSDDVWRQLDDVIEHKYKFLGGHSVKISLTFMDEGGHFTQEVRQRCRERQMMNVFAIKGAAGVRDIPYTSAPKKQKIVLGGRFIGTVWVYEIGVDAGKQKIVNNLRVQTPGPNYCHFPKRDDYGRDYFKSLMSEHLVYDKKLKNPWHWEKIPGHERNEAFDCRNYANAAFKALDPDIDATEKRIMTLAAGKAAPKKERAPRKPQRKLSDAFDDW